MAGHCVAIVEILGTYRPDAVQIIGRGFRLVLPDGEPFAYGSL